MGKLTLLVAGHIDDIEAVAGRSLPEATILAAPTGWRGVEAALANEPDVILLAAEPGVDGGETCRALRGHDRLKNVPIVFAATPERGQAERERALECGADVLLRLPADPLELASLVRSLASREATRSGATGATADRGSLESALRESEDQFRMMADNISQLAWMADPSGSIFWYNRRWYDFTGTTLEEMRGWGWQKVHHAEHVERVVQLIRRCFETGEAWEDTFPLRGKDGEYRWFLSRAVPSRDTEGRISRWFGTNTDVTELREAEERSRESRSKLEAALASMTDAVFISDVEGRFIDFNDAFATFHRFRDKASCATTLAEYPEFLDVFLADGTPAPLEMWAVPRALRGETAAAAEYGLRRKDTGECWFGSFSFSPIQGENGAIAGSVVVARDITKRKQAESALMHSRDLMRYVLEHMHGAVAVHDRELRYLYVSQRYLRDYGVKEKDIIGKHHYEVFPDLPLKRREVHQRVLAGEVLSAEDDPYERADGSVEWTRWECRPWYEEGGQIGGIIVYTELITKRKLAEEALRESEERHRAILQTAMDGFWHIDLEGRFLEVNETCCRMSGYSEQEMLRMSVADLEANESPEEAAGHIARLLAGGEDRFETRHRRKDGSIIAVEVSAQYKPEGPGRIVAFVRDITQRKKAENALQERNLYIETILENAPIGFAVNTINDSKALFVGHRFEEIYGVERGSLASVDDYFEGVFTDPDFRNEMRARMTADMASGDPARMRWENIPITTGGGERRYVTAINIPIPEQNLMVSTVQDVTGREEALQALQESEERWKYALEGSGDGVWDWNPDTGEVHYTRRWKEILGYEKGGIGNTVEEWETRIHPDDRESVLARLASHLNGDTANYSSEHRLRCKNGTYRWVLDRGKVISRDASGKPLRVIGTHADISERKLAEENSERLRAQLIQAQKMESIGRLAGGVAHDFNNLLTVINGYSDMAMGRLNPGDPLRASLAEIYKAGERAAGLTRQLLAFSRKQVMQLRVLDLNRVVGEMRSMLERLVGEDVEVRLALHPTGIAVHADPNQLEQVIMNLAVNARDAMPEGGRLLIETAIVERAERATGVSPEAQAGPLARLAVSDSGMGMDEATRQRIFEPFFTTKGAGKGTGLGLSTVQGIVVQSGGSIDVWSEPGRGTTFTIYLPALEDAVAESGHPEVVSALRGKETILVVEDQEEVRDYTAAVLKSYGYRVIEAANAGEAVMILEKESAQIELVLTDVVMPHISGRELADRLEKLKPGIRIVFMSGYTDDVILQHGVQAEDTHLIQKPFRPWELAQKIRAALGPTSAAARIVIADDEDGIRSFLRAVLEHSGYEVIEASEGEQAMSEVIERQADLLITDLVMPEQEGVIGALRGRMPGVGIIAISGAFGGASRSAARVVGADAVLAKPVRAQQLLAKVAEVLALRR